MGACGRLVVAELRLDPLRQRCLLLGCERLHDRFIGQSLLFDLAQSLDLVVGVCLELGEHRLLVLDVAATPIELALLDGELLLGEIELVE